MLDHHHLVADFFLRPRECESFLLSLSACRGGKLYLQASGWRVAKKDRIDLDIGSLKEAQGLYTCPPAVEGGKAFSCCLKVEEDMQVTRQVFSVLDLLLQAGQDGMCRWPLLVTGLGPQES